MLIRPLELQDNLFSSNLFEEEKEGKKGTDKSRGNGIFYLPFLLSINPLLFYTRV